MAFPNSSERTGDTRCSLSTVRPVNSYAEVTDHWQKFASEWRAGPIQTQEIAGLKAANSQEISVVENAVVTKPQKTGPFIKALQRFASLTIITIT